DVPAFLVQRISNLLDLRYKIPSLPFGLEVTGVTVGDDGLDVTVEGKGIVLGG
ncbi:MAG: DUF2993 domain-containing protein, partial [Geodermatophilales bacterium]|nr:DUF2993 domain-containing protein [Geodermatophilales bacterium]